MRFNSYSPQEICRRLNYEVIWELDTGGDGYDDVLLGTKDQIMGDILDYFELDDLPKHWRIRRVDPMDFLDQYGPRYTTL